MIKKIIAFTLAETLIVIAIIGVVASLTLPNLNSSTGDKERVTKVKKIYASLTEAYERAVVVYGPLPTWFNGLTTDDQKAERFKNRIIEFLKFSKDCGHDEGCWSTAPLYEFDGIDNYYENLNGQYYYFVNLADGMSLAMTFSSIGPSAKIRVDIDGPNKGKTQTGSDIFDFNINTISSGTCPILQLFPSECCSMWTGDFEESTNGNYATTWVIQNGNVDYLKATFNGSTYECPNGENLNWETKTSCN